MTKTLNSMPTTDEVRDRAADLGDTINDKAHELGTQVSERVEEVASKLPELHRPKGWAVNVGPPERMLSVIGGLALVGYGLVRRSPTSLALGLVGGDLLVRGLTGHCVAYQGLGIQTVNGSNGHLLRNPVG